MTRYAMRWAARRCAFRVNVAMNIGAIKAVMHLEEMKLEWACNTSASAAILSFVILSGAGKHGRSRRTSNIRGFWSGA